jgi:peptide/nickel transport system permease protein
MAPAALPVPQHRERGYWSEAWHELRSDRAAMVGAAIVVVLVLLAVLAGPLSQHPPNEQTTEGLTSVGDPLPPGSLGFLLGTDGLGRDELARALAGARVSLVVGVLANIVAAVLGILIGGVAGLSGRRVQSVLMRIADVIVSFPVLLLAMTLLSVLSRPGIVPISIVIGINFGGYLARLVFAQTIALREREFVVAARAAGAGWPYVLTRHVIPHIMPSVIVYSTLGTATAIQIEAALSYVGLGIRPPTASWGNMISDGQPYLFSAPWLVLVPGLAIFLTMIGFSLLGDGLRDALDPTLERRGLRSVLGVR